MSFHLANIQRTKENAERSNGNDRNQPSCHSMRHTAGQVKIHRALRQWRTSEQCASDVPSTKQRWMPAHKRCQRFSERTHTVGSHPKSPPEIVHRSRTLSKSEEKVHSKRRRYNSGDNREVVRYFLHQWHSSLSKRRTKVTLRHPAQDALPPAHRAMKRSTFTPSLTARAASSAVSIVARRGILSTQHSERLSSRPCR